MDSILKSGLRQWHCDSEYNPDWQDRVKWVVGFLPPDTLGVVDIGAGRMAAKPLLPPGVTYTPVDLTSLFGAEHLLDLNAAISAEDLPDGDCCIVSGVVEYLSRPTHVMSVLAQKYRATLTTFNPTPSSHAKRQDLARRRHLGWVNDHTTAEFASLLEQAGWQLNRIERFPAAKQGGNFVFVCTSTHLQR